MIQSNISFSFWLIDFSFRQLRNSMFDFDDWIQPAGKSQSQQFKQNSALIKAIYLQMY